MKNKARVHYWIDVIIAVGFILTAVSGLVLYLVPSGGYQGGRNPYYGREVMFLAHDAWKALHTWSSLAMTAGVLVHLVLHWRWMVCMTRNSLKRMRRLAAGVCRLDGCSKEVSSPSLQNR